jgi:hypothetical protein
MESSILDALNKAGPRPPDTAKQADKKNYAERLSRQLAQLIAGRLRPSFRGIFPDETGRGQESPARTAKGFKKLDVNYSTTELGLGLGVSIKTVTARDPRTKRYTKNYTRIDAELRAEAVDYHKRQPFAVMVALIFLAIDACDDAKARDAERNRREPEPSSFGAAVRIFRLRANRQDHRNDLDLFERVLIGLYETEGENAGQVQFFDVMDKPPRYGRPRASAVMTLDQATEAIRMTYDARNNPPFEWDVEGS